MGKLIDKNDFWFIEKNPITKVGVYPYLGKQISQDCEPNKIYYVLRPKEELFRKETLDSLRLIPLIDGHTMIGKDFTAPEKKGIDGTLGDNVSHDTDTIYNDLKIISNKMKDEIKNGKKELSLGYFCRYDKQPGTYKGQRYDYVQRDIIANHLALVDKGRMGADVRVYDSKNIPEGEAFAMDSIDIAIDKDEDIEWITVRGTHIPIKKGESKEQAVKKFLEERNRNNKNFQKHEENKKKEIEITNKKIEWTGFKVDENNNAYTKKYEDGTEAIVYEDYSDEAGKYHIAEITDKNGKKTKRLFMTENPETVFKMLNDTKDKEQSGSKTEPEENKTEKNKYKNNKINGWSSPTTAKKVETLKKILQKPITATEAKDKLYDILGSDDLYDKLDDMEERYPKKDVRNIIEEFISDNEISLDSSIEEYKTIQGEGKMADKKEKVAIDEDKRKLIDEIGGILKDKVDEELWKTIIGKAEKLAYNGSEAGKGTDEGEETAEKKVVNEEEGKDKKAAKDKCGKDEEKDEESKKKEIVKEFAKKEKLAKEVEDALGTFDHSEMTELEVAKYACDKLELGATEGQELATLKGYLKGIAKAPKVTYGYKKVAQDSGITEDEEDEEFEKFTKGE